MSTRRPVSWIAALLAAVLLGATALTPSPARAAADEYVLYYTVTAGQPATLAEVAGQLLGDTARATEIFNLNTGRAQPAGGALSDPNKLTAGWYLVLPWDAVGNGVQYGVLPTTPPKPGGAAPAPGASPAPGAAPAPAPGSAPGAAPYPTGAAGVPVSPLPNGGSPANPSAPASGRPGPSGSPRPPSASCVTATAASAPSNWATVKLAPELAWQYTRGLSEMVAVIDSGVQAGAPQLGSRVAPGANIATGGPRGDEDCLGSGTAMAGLVAAQPTEKDTFTGMAPDANIMPIRLVTEDKTPDKAKQAAAIDVAVSTGVTVIALGSYVDITADAVARAVQNALDKGISVVAAAPVAATGAVTPPDDVILVGAIGVDGKTAAEYAPGTVEVVAPGVNIASLGINGTTFVGSGTQYAVALTAGVVALIRASHPDLGVTQIANRLQVTSNKMGDAQPDQRYGYGQINPEGAVTAEITGETTLMSADGDGAQPVGGGNAIRIAFLLTVLAGLVLSALLVFRFRRTMRQPPEDDPDDDWPAGAAPDGTPSEPTSATSR